MGNSESEWIFLVSLKTTTPIAHPTEPNTRCWTSMIQGATVILRVGKYSVSSILIKSRNNISSFSVRTNVTSSEYLAELNQPKIAETEHSFFRPTQAGSAKKCWFGWFFGIFGQIFGQNCRKFGQISGFRPNLPILAEIAEYSVSAESYGRIFSFGRNWKCSFGRTLLAVNVRKWWAQLFFNKMTHFARYSKDGLLYTRNFLPLPKGRLLWRWRSSQLLPFVTDPGPHILCFFGHWYLPPCCSCFPRALLTSM